MAPVHGSPTSDLAVHWPHFPGARDQDLGATPLAQRFRVHAGRLEEHHRSPFSVALIRQAADDLDAGGVVAALFDGDPCPPGSVPALRLLAVVHRLALSDRAPELARVYDAVGRGEPVDVWPVVEAALEAHLDDARAWLGNTVQVNEVARSAALFGALLWLTERHRLPIRLLEIGACAGFNLLPDRYRYRVAGRALGDPASPLELVDPWAEGLPVADPWAMAERLTVCERGGCDPAPVDVSGEEGRLTLLSFIAPDERAQLTRLRLAFEVAAPAGVRLERAPAAEWLAGELAQRRPGTLTVVWQSVIRQYASGLEQAAMEETMAAAAARADEGEPLAWLTLEPGVDHVHAYELACQDWPGGDRRLLALCGDLGPPVLWRS
jgi:hypothetical protein